MKTLDHSKRRSSLWAWMASLVGVGMGLLAILASGASIEQALLGESRGQLAWGPALFRGMLLFHGFALILAAWLCTRCSRIHCNSALPVTNTGQADREQVSIGAWFFLVAICAAALALRLWKLDSCLWYDELMTVVDFLQRPLREIVAIFPSQNQHMLYSVLGRASFVLFGEGAASARVPAVMFGVLSIWALFLLGKRTLGVREALLACALMAVSYHHVWFSQNARGYTGLLFFSILSTWLFLESLDRGGFASWVGYGVAISLGTWTHMTMLFVVGAHGVVFLGLLGRRFFARKGARAMAIDPGYSWKTLLAWAFGGTLTLQLHALSLPEFLGSALHEESKESEWTDPFWVVRESLARLQDAGMAGFVVLVGMFVVVCGVISVSRRDWRLGPLMLLPALLGGGTMVVLGHNLWPRFFFFCMGFVILMAVRGATVVSDLTLRLVMKGDRRNVLAYRVGTALTILVIVASSITVGRCYALPKQDYTGARDFVESQRKATDGVVAIGLAADAYQRYFAPHWSMAYSQQELDEVRARYEALWLVYTLPTQAKNWYPKMWEDIQNDFEIVETFYGSLGDGHVYVCRLRAADAVPAQVGDRNDTQ